MQARSKMHAVTRSVMIRLWQRLLISLFQIKSFRYAFYDFQTSIRAPSAPRLFIDPFECIGADVSTHAAYYENDSIQALRQFIINNYSAKDILYVDIGANIGNHLVPLSGIYSRAIAFEPVPFNYHVCTANLLYNNISNVEVHPLALGSGGQESVVLRIPQSSPWGQADKRNNGIWNSTAGAPDDQVIVAPVRTGDSFLGQLGNHHQTVLIKIDCEGAELDVLRGMSRFLAENVNQSILLAVEMLDSRLAADIYQFISELRVVKLHAKHGTAFRPVQNLQSLPIPNSMVLMELTRSSVK